MCHDHSRDHFGSSLPWNSHTIHTYIYIHTLLIKAYITKGFTIVLYIYILVPIHCTMERTLSLMYSAISVGQCVQRNVCGK